MLSQFGDTKDIETCYYSGADAYLLKPVTYTQWLDCLAVIHTFWWADADLPEPRTKGRKPHVS